MQQYGVPDLQLDVVLLALEQPGAELDSDGHLVLLAVALVGVLQQHAGLADS